MRGVCRECFGIMKNFLAIEKRFLFTDQNYNFLDAFENLYKKKYFKFWVKPIWSPK